MTRPTLRQLFTLLGPFLGLAFVVAVFCVKPEVRAVFLTGGNFKIIITQTVIVAIGALGMTLIIVSGGIDLSVGSIVALTSVVGAKLLSLPQPWSTPAVIAAIGVLLARIGRSAGGGERGAGVEVVHQRAHAGGVAGEAFGGRIGLGGEDAHGAFVGVGCGGMQPERGNPAIGVRGALSHGRNHWPPRVEPAWADIGNDAGPFG